jgi:hypothetical protein
MKAKVLKRFKDKHSGEIYNAGDVITISKKRYDEILEVDRLVEKIAPEKEEKKTSK